MKINGVGPGETPSRTEPVRSSEDDSAMPTEELRVGAVDRADISSEGMSLARKVRVAVATEAGMDPALFELIQTRLESGFYKQPEVIDEIARRLVTAGDL